MDEPVARVVFRPGRITYRRIVGAVLLYLTIGLTFVALEVIDLTGLAMRELRKRVSLLPDHTAILYSAIYQRHSD